MSERLTQHKVAGVPAISTASPEATSTPSPEATARIGASGRARPMAPTDRRNCLIRATIPLLCEYGAKVTTRRIAEAAGVAEGTIFRVFKDKDELIQACVKAVFDPLPALAELNAIDTRAPVRERLVAIIGVLQRRVQVGISLSIALRTSGGCRRSDHGQKARRSVPSLILARVAALLEPDRAAFRLPVPEVARALWLTAFAGSHPDLTGGRLMAPDQIADLLLDGLRRRDDAPRVPAQAPE